MKTIDALIIIISKNEEENIKRCLNSVFSQKTNHTYEVIVIDSGSTDGTVDIIRSFKRVSLKQIGSDEFGHGRTRNLGMTLTAGKYLVFLNSDAIPANDKWLNALLDNFKNDDKVAGVYSRHISREGCYSYYANELNNAMGPIKEIKSFEGINKYDKNRRINDLIRFSTVSCAIRRDILEKYKFNENILLAEDQDWSKRILESGFKIIYEPTSMVYHSHNYTIKQKFIYHMKCTMCFNEILNHKMTGKGFILSLIYIPPSIIFEALSIHSYGRAHKHGYLRILYEIYIYIVLYLAGICGNIYGNIRTPSKGKTSRVLRTRRKI